MLSSLVLCLSVVAVGGWVGTRIADGVLRGTSGAAALYMTNFVEPYVQSMDEGGWPSEEDARRLDAVSELLKSRRHVASVKIWGPDGTIVYSTQKGLIGKRFPTTDIAPSLQGEIRAGMANLNDDDSEFERSLSMPLYEIFLPLYKNETEKIIAVAEVYEDASALLRNQASAARGAWLVVGSVGLGTLLALFVVVYRGSATIKRQRSTIKQRFREKMLLHRKNNILKSETEEALRTAARVDDLVHTRLGAELHDGPAQLLSFVLLRLEDVEQQLIDCPPSARKLLKELRSALEDALRELRAIAADLLLPEVGDDGNLPEVLRNIIRTYEGRTACIVDFEVADVPEKLPREVIRCAVRVTQEALNNASKHSGSTRQTVMLQWDDGMLRISVRDDGCGLSNATPAGPHSGLGMLGMASRVRALGGTFLVLSSPQQGTEILCELFVNGSRTEPPPGATTRSMYGK
ncbi:sensor histidine kinase [Bradyrhizobium sp. SSUT77]|uniref:sensor histidine kinase n=1 Tax=Bradyrhizobium sp. SSUT77 TaxID=3040603 RepID=UPI00244B049C|nr:sensor histidine kinase [Bradyrhizobium sp. SSUT77]MDH2348626.1 sensor histidine kinase [Bradyrhizobium sp. SSUT77]